MRAVGTACAAFACMAFARTSEAALLALLALGLLLAEPLDQDAAALAVREQPGALGPRGLASLGPGGFGRRPLALVALAAIVPAQRRVVLPPRIAAARPAGWLVVALLVRALPPALVAAPWVITGSSRAPTGRTTSIAPDRTTKNRVFCWPTS